jgi:hypothetical protein
MRKTGLALVLLAGVLSVAAGCRYLLASEFMPYHAVVAGQTWAQLEPGVRTIVSGMLTIVGGGFLSCGAALLWLLVPLKRNETWARWAVASVVAALWIPTQFVTLMLKSASSQAQPPIVPTAIILALVVLGLGALVMARPGTSSAAV